MKRYYRELGGGQWLARVDGNPVLGVVEAAAHAAAEYGLAGVTVVDIVDDADPRSALLLQPPPTPITPDAEFDRIAALAESAATASEVGELIKKFVLRAIRQGVIRRA